MWPILAAVALGGAKGIQAHGQNKQRKRDLMLKAATQEYSPWSGLNPDAVPVSQRASILGNLLGGAATGYSLGSSVASPEAAGAATGTSSAGLSAAAQDVGNQQLALQASQTGAVPNVAQQFQMPELGSSLRKKRSPWLGY